MVSFSTDHINYLQRNFLGPQVSVSFNALFRGIRNYDDLRLLHIQGLSRFWLGSDEKALATRQLMADLYAGLHAEQVPTIFMVLGTMNRISIYIGSFRDNETWISPLSPGGVIGDIQTIAGSLQGAFPGIFLSECSNADWDQIYTIIRSAPGCSLITGTPTAKLGTEHMGVEQIERLIRGMYGQHWGYMVVAKPYPPQTAVNFYNQGLNELREVTNAQSATAANPIAEAYAELLKRYLSRHDAGKTTGLWRVSAYCFGADPLAYLRVRAVTQAAFAGSDSLPDPLRVINCYSYVREIAHLGQLVLPCQHPAPGGIVHEHEYASVLHSGELATLAHLPQEEMPGYVVRDYARFDVSPPDLDSAREGARLRIGEIMDRGHPTGNDYTIHLDRLTEHGLIVGVTGSGKTNTAFHLLKSAWKHHVPFLIIEPAKAEYRQLLDASEHPEIGSALRVFTLGDERIAPFRLNPFQVLSGIPVQTHIDHLKAVFNASFAMYGPMPQVLEQCIYEIYEDRGWEMATGQNRRGDHPQAHPTLTDLFHKIDAVVEGLGYGPRITPELKAALKVRINSLRVGGKGLMLDTPLSIPMETLLEQPTILELQPIGDDDEKAFIIGLVWVFLYEYHRTNARSGREESRLRHLTLIEEAHRLLTDVPVTTSAEVANIRGKAVETFSQILSEIRAYGEGVLIADQLPVRLSPDAVKNTSLKVVHRLVSEQDRLAMGGAMNLDEHQERYVATLGKGEAAVYAEGDDRAYLVYVPFSKDQPFNEAISLTPSDAPDIRLLSPSTGDATGVGGDDDIHIVVGPSSDDVSVEILCEPSDGAASTEPAEKPIKVILPPQVAPSPETSSPPQPDWNSADGTTSVVFAGSLDEPTGTPLRVDMDAGTGISSGDDLSAGTIDPGDEFLRLDVEAEEVTSQLDSDSPSAPTLTVSLESELSVDDERVRQHMATFCEGAEVREVFRPRHTACPICKGSCVHRALAYRVAAEPEVRESFRRYALTCTHDASYLKSGLDELHGHMLRHIPYVRKEDALTCLILRLLTDDYFRFLGDAYQWRYVDVERLQLLFLAALGQVVLPAAGVSEGVTGTAAGLSIFQSLYHDLCRRPFDPYPQCGSICPHGACLYRFNLAPLVHQPWLDRRYTEAINQRPTDGDESSRPDELLRHKSQALRRVAQAATRRVLAGEVPEEAWQRIGACFLVQKAYNLPEADAEQRLKAARHGMASVLDVSKNAE